MLPEIVDTVGAQMEIMFDGGIRTGMDVVRAFALGAKSCMIGRAYACGLGAGGQEDVAKALDILAKEMLTTMRLCGVNTIAGNRRQFAGGVRRRRELRRRPPTRLCVEVHHDDIPCNTSSTPHYLLAPRDNILILGSVREGIQFVATR